MLQKAISFIATFALLTNSLAPSMTVLAQELPSPTPVDTSSPLPTDPTPSTSSGPSSLTTSPTAQPDATPAETLTPTPEVTPSADLVTPIPTDQPVVTQAPESNPTTQGPPNSTQPSASLTASPTVQPTATPKAPTEHGTLTETVINNVDLSGVNTLNSNVADSGTIATNQADYSPTSLVLITGSGFIANKDYTINIVSTDQPPVNFTDKVKADSTGKISYAYQLDGNYRPNYTVYIKSGEVVVATTTFTDTSSVNIEQCANGKASGPFNICKKLSGNDGYVTGSVNATKAHWNEGDFLPYRALIEAPNSGAQQLQFSFDTAKGSELKHAIDYLSSFSLTETTGAASTFHANQHDPCSDFIGGCNPASPNATASIPVPASLTSLYPAACANGSFSGSATSGLISAWVSTGTLTGLSVSIGNPATSGDCVSIMTVNFTLSNPNAKVVLAWSGHVASNNNPGSGGYWGIGNAVPTGSPYHFHAGFPQLSGGQSYTVGNQDLQLASTAVIVADSPTVSTNIHLGSNHTTDVQGATIAIGSTIHDKATVSNTGTNGTPQGTATFSFYNNGTCSNPAAATSLALALSTGSVDATGFPQGSLSAGNYSFKATYTSSDLTKWNNAVGSCESVTVGQGTSTVTTTLHEVDHSVVTVGSSVPLGTVMHDLATVTVGGSFAPTGNVDFRFYTSLSACTNDTGFVGGTTKGSIALVGNPGIAHPSSDTGALGAGTYAFKAKWAGDGNYTGNTSGCENFTVSQSQLSMESKVHNVNHVDVTNSSVPLGSIFHDTAKITGGVVGGFTPAAITFKFYTNGSCSLGETSISNTGADEGDATRDRSVASSALGAGSYSYKAFVAGDSNYIGTNSGCEPFTVDKETPSVVTAIHNADDQTITSVDAGSTVHDSATVSGNFVTPTGNVDFTFYNNGTCTPQGTSAGTVALISGVADPSNSEGPLDAGSHSFKAHYNGDGNYNSKDSDCEPLTVGTVTPGLSTTPSATPSSVLGATLSDSATLSGGFNPTGTITFTLYHSLLSKDCSGNPAYAPQIVGISNSSASTNPGFIAFAAGFWNWIASYSGDKNNNPVSGNCGDESLTINKANTSVTTQVHNSGHSNITNTSVALGTSIHDSATVLGQIGDTTITGDLTYNFFTNGTCSGDPSTSQKVPVGTESSIKSGLGAGSYSYQVNYSGDSNYNGSKGACEPFTINKANSSVTTTIHDANHGTVGDSTFLTSVHDQAGVLGLQGFDKPTGSVNFTFFYGGFCDATNVPAGTVSLVNGIADPSNTEDLLSPGTYSFRAIYGGDANYNGAAAGCETFRVIAPPAVSITKTNDSGGGISAGSTVTYTLTISNNGGVDFDNVLVTDILPGGFTYVDGSTTGATFINQIGPKLSWNIASLTAGSTAVVTYQVTTNPGLTDGDYKNFATCEATYNEESQISCDQVNSNVHIGHGVSYGGNIPGQVLGISTELPATGSPTALLIVSLGLLGTGLFLRGFSKKEKKNVKN